MKTLTHHCNQKSLQKYREAASLINISESLPASKLQLMLKLILVLLISLFFTKNWAMAQDEADTRFSSLTVSEHYVETIHTLSEDGYVDYSVVPSKLYSNLAVSARFSSEGM